MVYLFQLVPVIFTYLRADCPCDVTTFVDLTSFRLLIWSVWVGSPGQKPLGQLGPGSKILTRFHLCVVILILYIGVSDTVVITTIMRS